MIQLHSDLRSGPQELSNSSTTSRIRRRSSRQVSIWPTEMPQVRAASRRDKPPQRADSIRSKTTHFSARVLGGLLRSAPGRRFQSSSLARSARSPIRPKESLSRGPKSALESNAAVRLPAPVSPDPPTSPRESALLLEAPPLLRSELAPLGCTPTTLTLHPRGKDGAPGRPGRADRVASRRRQGTNTAAGVYKFADYLATIASN